MNAASAYLTYTPDSDQLSQVNEIMQEYRKSGHIYEVKQSFTLHLFSEPELLATPIRKSEDANAIFHALWSDTLDLHESMYILLLSAANKVISYGCVSVGELKGAVINKAAIARLCVLCNAASFVVAHNHPSNNIQPSNADKIVTEHLQQIGALLDIRLLDHLIITSQADTALIAGKGYYSFADEGLL